MQRRPHRVERRRPVSGSSYVFLQIRSAHARTRGSSPLPGGWWLLALSVSPRLFCTVSDRGLRVNAKGSYIVWRNLCAERSALWGERRLAATSEFKISPPAGLEEIDVSSQRAASLYE